MVVINQKLLDEMKVCEKCDFCGEKIPFADPHHVDARAMGGGRRLDIRQNIARLCPTFHGNNCHHKVTVGRISKDDMLACIAKREKTTPERLRRYLDSCHQTPKEGPLPAWENDMQLSIHPIADTFPEVTGKAYEDIKASIAQNGVRRPVLVWKGQLIDGKTRLRACKELGTECPTDELDCDETEAIRRAIDENAHRRHLDSNAYLMSVARAVEMMEETTKKRAVEIGKTNLKQGTEKPEPSRSVPNGTDRENAGETKKSTERTREAVAKKAGVSPRKAARAIKINKHAPEEVKKAVAQDKISVGDAAAVAKKPPEVQREALKKVEAGHAKTLAEAVEQVEKASTPDDVRDARGRIIPAAMLPKFQAQQKLSEILATLQNIQPQLTRFEKELFATYPSHPIRHQAQEHLKQVRSCLEYLMNGFICPRCHGAGEEGKCACCHNRLWFFGGASEQVDEKVWGASDAA